MKTILLKFSTVLLLSVLTITLNAQTVYITKTGEKYHKSSCYYLSHSKQAIELSEAEEKGYTPCKVCKPKENSNSSTESNSTSSTATQCTGKTQSGARCKRKTTDPSGRCYQHK